MGRVIKSTIISESDVLLIHWSDVVDSVSISLKAPARRPDLALFIAPLALSPRRGSGLSHKHTVIGPVGGVCGGISLGGVCVFVCVCCGKGEASNTCVLRHMMVRLLDLGSNRPTQGWRGSTDGEA